MTKLPPHMVHSVPLPPGTPTFQSSRRSPGPCQDRARDIWDPPQGPSLCVILAVSKITHRSLFWLSK